MKYNPLRFSICICYVRYIYFKEIYTYRYYEWYIPLEIDEETTWEIYFFASRNMTNIGSEETDEFADNT